MGTPANQLTHNLASPLVELLQCPHCGANSLNEHPSLLSIECNACENKFPLLSFGETTLPFLFSDVNAATYDWCSRINGFNKKLDEDIELLNAQIKQKKHSKLTRNRLKHLLNAKKLFQEQIGTHLKCFQEIQADGDIVQHAEIARNQGVDSYVNNVFRDWCWNNGENEQLLEAVKTVVNHDFNAGLCLTLGAGAGRLAYDFHNQFNVKHSVLLDINPVLLGYAAKIICGEAVKLNEFPIAPLSLMDNAVEQTCKSEYLVNKNEFTFILADAINAPLKSKLFDTVMTPWFIDIIPIDFKDFIPHVNRLLKPGGLWINSGSLAFFHRDLHWNYSDEEIIDLLKKYGFTDITVNRSQVNYMHSPHSSHGRIENIFSFSATKKFDSIEAKKHQYLPEWIEKLNLPIPKQAHVMAVSSKYLLQAQVLSAIDGQRSIYEIGCLLAKQYDMPEAQAIAAVRKILIENI